MKSLKTVIISATAVAALYTSVLAGPVGVQRNYPIASQPSNTQAEIAQLREASDEVARLRLKPGTGGPRQVRYMEKQSELDSLIDRLGAGENVSPEEIDRALAR
jgi:hypothetical protein